jgi:Putative prokaryotic signal transducing protein
MADSDAQPSSARRIVTTAANEAEAELFRQRLAQAGVQATSERAIGGPEMGASGARYIYVSATDLERAREVLAPSDEPGLGG